ncbi:hypothetical protein ALC56_01884 [Trachymyrmex septentrionalis]|uniref:Uncharacterized protein n=1 Tax=Trachymyrmex septentrionalis TaxID=34720 RepID=A0A195FTK6_9HYME|nr:hypothetical protein ALC56_01884 [Trachymyrmex septentrionalis]
MNVPSTSRVRNVANELPRVKSECFALRIKISRGLLRPCALKEHGEKILIYTMGVLTSLKNGRLIAQSRIIRRFRVTKPRRGGLYQLDVRAIAREKVKKRARGRLRHTGEGRVRGARCIYECTFRIHFGRVICGNGERASEWPCFICEVREELQLCGGTLSFVIRGGDRLSAVVRFGSNMSYVRGEPADPTDYPELLKKSNNNLDNEAMPVDRQRERGRLTGDSTRGGGLRILSHQVTKYIESFPIGGVPSCRLHSSPSSLSSPLIALRTDPVFFLGVHTPG